MLLRFIESIRKFAMSQSPIWTICQKKKKLECHHKTKSIIQDGQVGQRISCVSSYGRTTIYWQLCSTFWQPIRFICKQESIKSTKSKERDLFFAPICCENFCGILKLYTVKIAGPEILGRCRNFSKWPKFRDLTNIDFYCLWFVENGLKEDWLGSMW